MSFFFIFSFSAPALTRLVRRCGWSSDTSSLVGGPPQLRRPLRAPSAPSSSASSHPARGSSSSRNPLPPPPSSSSCTGDTKLLPAVPGQLSPPQLLGGTRLGWKNSLETKSSQGWERNREPETKKRTRSKFRENIMEAEEGVLNSKYLILYNVINIFSIQVQAVCFQHFFTIFRNCNVARSLRQIFTYGVIIFHLWRNFWRGIEQTPQLLPESGKKPNWFLQSSLASGNLRNLYNFNERHL